MISVLGLIAWVSLTLALVPAIVLRANLRDLPPAGRAAGSGRRPSISVLIPARDEEDAIEASVAAALASRDVEVEVVVLDDHSRDATAAIVAAMARATIACG